MTILVGQKAPLFQTQAVMPNGEINGDFSLGTLIKDKIVIIEGSIQNDGFSGGLTVRAKSVRSLEQVRQKKNLA